MHWRECATGRLSGASLLTNASSAAPNLQYLDVIFAAAAAAAAHASERVQQSSAEVAAASWRKKRVAANLQVAHTGLKGSAVETVTGHRGLMEVVH